MLYEKVYNLCYKCPNVSICTATPTVAKVEYQEGEGGAEEQRSRRGKMKKGDRRLNARYGFISLDIQLQFEDFVRWFKKKDK
jgi:hypothetical protein